MSSNTFGDLISQGYTFAQGIIAICAFFMFVLAGLAYMIPYLRQKVGDPNEIMKNVVIGVVLLFSSYIILNTINHSLVVQPAANGLPLSGQQSSSTDSLLPAGAGVRLPANNTDTSSPFYVAPVPGSGVLAPPTN